MYCEMKLMILVVICVASEARIAADKENSTISVKANNPVRRFSSRVPTKEPNFQMRLQSTNTGFSRRPKSTITHKFASNYRDPTNVRTKYSDFPKFLYGYQIHYPREASEEDEVKLPEAKKETDNEVNADDITRRMDEEYYTKRRQEIFVPYQPPTNHHKITTHRPNYRFRLEPQNYYPVHKPSAAGQSSEVYNKHGPPYGALTEAPSVAPTLEIKPTIAPVKKYYPPIPDAVKMHSRKRPQPTQTEATPKVVRVNPTRQKPPAQHQSEEIYNQNGPPYGALPGIAPAVTTMDTFPIKVSSSNERGPPKKYVTPKTPSNSKPRPISRPIPSDYPNHQSEQPDGRRQVNRNNKVPQLAETRTAPAQPAKDETKVQKVKKQPNRLHSNDFKYFQ
jgi:hypothetical protein